MVDGSGEWIGSEKLIGVLPVKNCTFELFGTTTAGGGATTLANPHKEAA
jgi:hypothetical protein